LGVNDDLGAGIQLFDKLSLYRGVRNSIVVNVSVEFVSSLTEILLGLIRSEDFQVELVINRIVSQVLDDDGCFLLVNQADGFSDKALWVGLELGENGHIDSLHNVRNRPPG